MWEEYFAVHMYPKHQLRLGTRELYIGVKLVNASLQKVLAYVIRVVWWFGFFLLMLGLVGWLAVVVFGGFFW